MKNTHFESKLRSILGTDLSWEEVMGWRSTGHVCCLDSHSLMQPLQKACSHDGAWKMHLDTGVTECRMTMCVDDRASWYSLLCDSPMAYCIHWLGTGCLIKTMVICRISNRHSITEGLICEHSFSINAHQYRPILATTRCYHLAQGHRCDRVKKILLTNTSFSDALTTASFSG